MNKLIGSCFLLAGGFLFRWVRIQERKQSQECLESLLAALRWMEEEIDGQQRPLPLIFKELAQRGTLDSRRFFQLLYTGIQTGHGLTESWRTAVQALPLSEECLRILSALGEQLNSRTENACAAIQRTCKRLEREREQAEAEAPQMEKQLTVFSFSAAALLIVLLI